MAGDSTTERTLYGFWISPYMATVAQLLGEAGLEYEYERVSPYAGDTLTSEHRQRNPVGKIPCLKDEDGQMIYESLSICRYLARTYPRAHDFYPCGDAAACLAIDQKSDFITFSISGPFFNCFVIGGYFPQAFKLKTEKESQLFTLWSLFMIKGMLGRLMQSSAMSPFLLGGSPTLADFQLFHILQLGKTFSEVFKMPMMDLMADDEALQVFYRAMSDRPVTQSILTFQEAEREVTEQEIFEKFGDAYAPVLDRAREILPKMFGHEV